MRTRSEVCSLAAFLAVTVLVGGCGEPSRTAEPTKTAETTQITLGEAECERRIGSMPTGGAVVTLFHETHTHGRLAGTPERDLDVPFARYVGLIEGLRSCLREPEASVFVGNGDDLEPFLNDVHTDGEHTVDAFNAAGIDANTFGFSELSIGVTRLRELVAASEFAWVSANVREGNDRDQVLASEQGARRWIVEDVGGVRVGMTGLLSTTPSDEIPPPFPPGADGDVQVVDPVRAMRRIVPEMRAAGADVVVVLAHMIHQDTLRVVRAVKGIDVAVGTHLGLHTARPTVVNGAIVAVAGPDELQALGQLDLAVEDGRVVDFAFHRHIPSASDPIDPAVESAVAKHLRRS